MSARASAVVWTHSKAKGGALLVLLAIADHAHEDGYGSYPSVDTIARYARMSIRGAQEATRTLERLGEVKVGLGEGPKGTNTYTILLPGLQSYADHRASDPPAESAPPPQQLHPADRRRDSAPEPKGTETSSKTLRAERAPKRSRPRDELWDALVAAHGREPETKSERGRWNKARKELADAGATAAQIRQRAGEYRKRWPAIDLTPTALTANWSALAPAPARQAAEPEEIPTCEHGLTTKAHCEECAEAERRTA